MIIGAESELDPKDLEFSVFLINVSEQMLEFEFEFANPNLISLDFTTKDVLHIIFKDEVFFSRIDYPIGIPEGTVIEIELSALLDDEQV